MPSRSKGRGLIIRSHKEKLILETRSYASLRLIYTCEVNGNGDGSGDVRCLRSCVSQMKEKEAET